MDQDLCLVWLYCVIDGVLRSIGRVRQRGPAPELTDAEGLTIQLWGEIWGLPNDASVWRDAPTNRHRWFPNLCHEWNFVRRCGSLAKVMDLILASLFGPTKDWNAFDGLPLPVCRNIRAARDRRFGGEAAWSFCAAKNEMYYTLPGKRWRFRLPANRGGWPGQAVGKASSFLGNRITGSRPAC